MRSGVEAVRRHVRGRSALRHQIVVVRSRQDTMRWMRKKTSTVVPFSMPTTAMTALVAIGFSACSGAQICTHVVPLITAIRIGTERNRSTRCDTNDHNDISETTSSSFSSSSSSSMPWYTEYVTRFTTAQFFASEAVYVAMAAWFLIAYVSSGGADARVTRADVVWTVAAIHIGFHLLYAGLCVIAPEWCRYERNLHLSHTHSRLRARAHDCSLLERWMDHHPPASIILQLLLLLLSLLLSSF